MVIHCNDSVKAKRKRDLESQWSGWEWEPHFPPRPCCCLPAGSPLLVCIQRACELFGVCVCVFTSMEKKCGDVNTLLLELPFLKLLVSQGVQHVCWRKDQCLQEWGFSCGCGSQPPCFPGAATATTSATQGRQRHCRLCVCEVC